MEIKYFGANCVRLSFKKTSIVFDDVVDYGAKSVIGDKDVQLVSNSKMIKLSSKASMAIDYPGEYEVSDASVKGVQARSHMDEQGVNDSVVYRVILDDNRIGLFGNIHPDITDDQLEELGTLDILIIPVGGNGFTLDPVGAQKIIKKIEPKVVIPTHFHEDSLKFEVPQQDLETAVKALGVEWDGEKQNSFKPKNIDLFEGTKLVVLSLQAK